MQRFLGELRRSTSIKVFGIAFLILVMLIPIAMTRGVVTDRMTVAATALHDIMRSWGQRQIVGGPILVVPFTVERVNYYDDRKAQTGHVYLLAKNLTIDTEINPEVRNRGLHEVPVYTASIAMRGVFAAPDTSDLGVDAANIEWDRAYFALSITDARAVRNTPAMTINSESSEFEAGGSQIPGFHPQIIAGARDILNAEARRSDFDFSIQLDLSGTVSLQFLPLADSTEISMTSSWIAPSFIGGHLPENRTIDDDGFNARWRVSSLGRELPSRWTSDSYHYKQTEHSSFGASLFVPVGIYQLTDRATKYAILFIGLTFVGYFLFEVISRLQLHPLQYLLVGLANTLFYLLLLSFAEHIGFGPAYLTSAAASIGLIGGYSWSILHGRRRATLIIAMLVCLYGFLYLTLSAETYALLAGAIGLWVSLGLVMYLTRRIDWYSLGDTKKR